MKLDHGAVLTNGRKSAEISTNGGMPRLENGFSGAYLNSFLLDLDRGSLFKDREEIPLRPKTFAFLHHLVANPGRLISKNELLETVWPGVAVTEDSIVQCVAELRRALGDHDQRLIRTIQKRGYRFDAELPVQSASAESIARPDELTRQARNAAPAAKPAFLPTRTAARLATAGGLVLLCLSGWLVWSYLHNRPSLAPPLSIVVVPFTSLDAEPAHEHFATGLTNDLTADLSRVPGLFVIAPATAQTLKGKPADARHVSREFNVRYLLEGDVRRTGDQIRINVQLIDGESGNTRWTERFDRKREQISEWQDEIVGRIANALDHRLTMLESERGLRERPNNPEAFDLAARGWATVYAAKTADSYHAAHALFRQAIERDTRAWNAKAGVAWSSGILLLNGWSVSAEADAEIARSAVAELLNADPNNVIAHHVRGFLLRYQRNTEAAKDAFATAVSINPNFAPGHAQLGVSELELGRPAQAIISAERALKLSPRDPNARSWFAFIGMGHLHLEHYTEAAVWLARAIDTPTPVALHQAYYVSALALSGRTDDARLAVDRLRQARPSMNISSLRASARSTNQEYSAQRKRLFEGLRLAGLPE